MDSTYSAETLALAGELIAVCRAQGVRIGTAESCTGGLIGGALTAVAGASEVFEGGVVAYQNRMKHRVLGVREGTLASVGAVSAACAEEMACGVRLALGGIEMGLSATGIAGPGGGTAEKPVGLVYIGCSVGNACWVEECRFSGDRAAVRRATVERILALALACLAERKRDDNGQD
ncbi:MAG: CinA family protein [Candidatus Spyradenecus sp.]